MTRRTTPPFRADHVGSLLRPRPNAPRCPPRPPPDGNDGTSVSLQQQQCSIDAAAPGGRAQRSGLVDEQAADVAAVEHVAVALVDVLQPIAGRDQFIELEPSGPVELEHPGDLVERVPAAE